MKHKSFIPLVAIASMLSLAACSGGSGGGGGGGGGGEGGHFDHEVTIKFSQCYAQGYQAKLQEFVDGFNKEEPNVKIKLEDGWISGNYDTVHSQTVSDIQTGEYGDLVLCYADHVVDYMDYGKAVLLDDYMDNAEYGWTEKEKADVVPGFLKEGQTYIVKGTYSLPFSKSTEAMFYNEEKLFDTDLVAFLATKDITMNKAYMENLTWEDLFEKLCPALKEYETTTGNKLIVNQENGLNTYVGYDSVDNLFITLAEQYGYGYTSVDPDKGTASLDFNNENMKGLMKVFANAAKEGYFTTPKAIGQNFSSGFFTEENILFSIGSTAGVSHQNSDNWQVGIARVPQAKGKDAKLMSQGPSVCILSHGDKDRELAAWLFYKYLVRTNNTAKWATTVGYLPVRTSAYTSEIYSEYCDETGKDPKSPELLAALNAKYSASTNDSVFTSPAFKGSSTARTQVGSLMSTMIKDVRTNGVTVDDAYLNNVFDLAVNNIKKDM